MPGDFGGPVCSCAHYYYLCTRDRGCTVHPAFPRALCFEGAEIESKPRAVRAARMRTHVSVSFPCFGVIALPCRSVIARSPCDEAIHSCSLACCTMDCFAYARNDGFLAFEIQPQR